MSGSPEAEPRRDITALFRSEATPLGRQELSRGGQRLAALRAPRLQPGQELAGYRIEAVLGSGGQATVYRGRAGQDEVAIKVPHPSVLGRMVREAQILFHLEHPSILRIEAARPEGVVPHIITELATGGSLADRLQALGPQALGLPYEEVHSIGQQVLQALAYAHRKGVVHRDLKPSNILFDSAGRVKLADFGVGSLELVRSLAHSLSGGTASRGLGTPLYVAPEQWSGGEPDARSDLYALGKVLYELLTSRRPNTLLPIGRFRQDAVPAWDDLIFALVDDDPGARPSVEETETLFQAALIKQRAGHAQGAEPADALLSKRAIRGAGDPQPRMPEPPHARLGLLVVALAAAATADGVLEGVLPWSAALALAAALGAGAAWALSAGYAIMRETWFLRTYETISGVVGDQARGIEALRSAKACREESAGPGPEEYHELREEVRKKNLEIDALTRAVKHLEAEQRSAWRVSFEPGVPGSLFGGQPFGMRAPHTGPGATPWLEPSQFGPAGPGGPGAVRRAKDVSGPPEQAPEIVSFPLEVPLPTKDLPFLRRQLIQAARRALWVGLLSDTGRVKLARPANVGPPSASAACRVFLYLFPSLPQATSLGPDCIVRYEVCGHWCGFAKLTEHYGLVALYQTKEEVDAAWETVRVLLTVL